jgi:hypothetical protein
MVVNAYAAAEYDLQSADTYDKPAKKQPWLL